MLIIGSGNLVHNLRKIDWSGQVSGFDWAIEANTLFKRLILAGDHSQLTAYDKLGSSVGLAVPTPEHYLPLLYILGLKQEKDEVAFFNDQMVMGSLSMTSLKIS